jgi:hypothetical protein
MNDSTNTTEVTDVATCLEAALADYRRKRDEVKLELSALESTIKAIEEAPRDVRPGSVLRVRDYTASVSFNDAKGKDVTVTSVMTCAHGMTGVTVRFNYAGMEYTADLAWFVLADGGCSSAHRADATRGKEVRA